MQYVCKKEGYFAIKFFFKPQLHFILISIFLFAIGCAPYQVEIEELYHRTAQGNDSDIVLADPVTSCEINKNMEEATSHWLYRIIPRHRCQIRWYDVGHWTMWMLFGNDDDGIFGEEFPYRYRFHQRNNLVKALAWTLRNPLHNFCFYVIGSANRRNSEITLAQIADGKFCMFHYLPQGNTVFASRSSSLFLALHGGKPFFSLRFVYSPKYRFDFYAGWRYRGNFGIKCHPFAKAKYKKKIRC